MQPLSGLRAQLLEICIKFWTHNYITAAHIFLLIHHYGRITHFFFRVRLIKKMSQRMITVLLQNLNFPYCIFFGLLVARGLGGSVSWEHLSWALIACRGVTYGKKECKTVFNILFSLSYYLCFSYHASCEFWWIFI